MPSSLVPLVVNAQDEGHYPAGLLEEGEDMSPCRPPRPSKLRFFRKGGALAALSSLALLATTWRVSAPQSSVNKVKGDGTGGAASISLATGGLAALAEGLAAAAKLAKDAQGGEKDLKKTWESLNKPADDAKVAISQQGPPPNITKLLGLKGKALLPKNRLQDSNLCPDHEEQHLNLCYKKCADLTEGKFPIRSTAFSCCMEEPCSFFNSRFTNPLTPCQGFDVAGKFGGLGRSIVCPHSPGDCLENEEFNLGVCYKKCAVLTNNTHIYRFAASSCCRFDSHLACLDPSNLLTSQDYNVGGGLGDATFEASAGTPHTPLPSLAEGF